MENSTEVYSVRLKELADEFKLEVMFVPENYDELLIYSSAVNRPGLALNGFYDCFDHKRIQLIGHAEHQFLSSISADERQYKLERLAAHNPPALVITSGLSAFDEIMNVCRKYGLPLFRTNYTTSDFQSAVIASLNIHLAPRIRRHGVFVEVYGEGILILGDSGIGKSETAIELVKRGHRLIADDAVEIKRVSEKTLVGTAPEIIKHYVEQYPMTYNDYVKVFNQKGNRATIKLLEDIKDPIRYLIQQECHLLSVDGKLFAVSTQWTKTNIRFIEEFAQQQGYPFTTT